MKKKLLYFFVFVAFVLSGCDKSIIEPTGYLIPSNQQQFITNGKVEFYNHIGNQGTIYIYIDGDYKAGLPNYYNTSTYYDCGFSTSTLAMYANDNLTEGYHSYQIRNVNNSILLSNYFYITKGNCEAINLFY